MTSRFLPLTLAGAAMAASLFAGPASAEILRNVSLDVQYDRAALATASGAETVLESLQDQARDACRYETPLAGAPRIDATCAIEVVAKAVAEINDDGLTSLHATRYPTQFASAY